MQSLPTPLLEVDGLTIGYKSRRGQPVEIVRHVAFSLCPRQSLGIVGESGCGKSTLALALLGYFRRGSFLIEGAVRLNGENLLVLPPKELERARGSRIALVPQNAGESLTPTLRVGSQVAEALTVHGKADHMSARDAAVEFLAKVRLPNPAEISRRYPHQLSGGQQQRAVIAMALAGEPELLVLDEPTTGLDVTTRIHILDLLEEIRDVTGVATILISHDLAMVAQVSERLGVMYAGEIVEMATSEALLSHAFHPYARALLASVPRVTDSGRPRSLQGRPPAPHETITGCAFSPRCDIAEGTCRTQAPPLENCQLENGGSPRIVQCHFWRRSRAAEPPRLESACEVPAPSPQSRPQLLRIAGLSADYARPSLNSLLRDLMGRQAPPPTLSEIGFSISEGQTVALVGESGCGKSTLARTIAGLMAPRSGSLMFANGDLGGSVEKRSLTVRKSIQIVFQNPDASLNPRHTVGRILEAPLRLFFHYGKTERRERAIALLDRVRLSPHYMDRYPGQLSGGEKQRVAIARAFAAQPMLVLCDEVTSALDVSVQAAVLDLLADLQAERGVAYLFISHDLAVVHAVADQVAVLYQGRLCEIGSAPQVFTQPSHPYTEILLAAAGNAIRSSTPRLLARDTMVPGPPTQGCVFHSRCPRRVGDCCEKTTPPWRTPDEGHLIRCHIALDMLGPAHCAPEGATFPAGDDGAT